MMTIINVTLDYITSYVTDATKAHAKLKSKECVRQFRRIQFHNQNVQKNFTEEQANHCAKVQGTLKM